MEENIIELDESGESVVELELERQEWSKIVPNSSFVPCCQGTYFSTSEREAKVILEELTVKELGMKLWLRISQCEEQWREALEAGLSFAVLIKKVKLTQSDVSGMRK